MQETSNSVCWLTVWPTNQKCKSRSKGCPVGHVIYFSFRTSFDLWNDIHYVCRISTMSTSSSAMQRDCASSINDFRWGDQFEAIIDRGVTFRAIATRRNLLLRIIW